jgi:CheY-like chemotaxis protein
MSHDRMLELLLVEDNPGDVRLAQECLRESAPPNRLRVVEDGVEAMAYVRQLGRYAGAPRPDLILLDLNLPRKDGCEVLAEIKSDEKLRSIPVVIFTSSTAERDISAAYQLQANSYVAKPTDLGELGQTMKSLAAFWLATAALPPPGR